MNKQILIFGEGFIGDRLREAWGCLSSGRKIYSFRDAQEEISRRRPRIVVNCIGFTGGKNVDGCEQDKDKTLSSNVFAPLLLAEACLRRGVRLVHLSSGCIYHFNYGKDAPLTEDRPPDFFDLFYSRSKIYAERSLEALSRRYDVLIPRIRIPLDDRPHPKNILDKLLRYREVIDLPNSVTYIPDFIKALRHLIAVRARGVYNIVNREGLRYPELLDVYRKHVPGFQYRVIDRRRLGLVRTNMLLSTRKLARSGFRVRSIREVLDECVKNYLKY